MPAQTKILPIQRLFRLFKPDLKEIRNIYAYAIFNGLLNLSLPLGIQAIINLIQGGSISTSWVVLVTFVVFGIAITGILQILQMKITEHIQQKIFARAAFEFAIRIPKMTMKSLSNKYPPELINRFFDTVSVQKGLPKILIDFSSSALQILFGLILLSFYHPFFMAFGVVLVLVVYFMVKLTGKRGLDTSIMESDKKYAVAHWLQEVARVHQTFKQASESLLPIKKTEKEVSQYLDHREKHFKILVIQFSMMVGFKVLIAAGLLLIGGILVMEQQMNIGQFVAAEIVILMVMNSVEKMMQSLENIYDVLTSLEKLGKVTDMPLEEEDGDKVMTPDQMRKSSRIRTLRIFDQEVANGKIVLIKGGDRNKKKALLRSFVGLDSTYRKKVTIDNKNLNHFGRAEENELMGYFSDVDSLFSASILDNITLGRPNATRDAVGELVNALSLESEINELEDGIETMILPHGPGLSLELKKKIMLARSIVHRPRILVVEGNFVGVSNKEKDAILEFLTERGRLCTVITTDGTPELANMADITLNMDELNHDDLTKPKQK